MSAYSLIAVSRYGAKIMKNSGSIVTLTYFGSTRAIPNYNMMGIAKGVTLFSKRPLANKLHSAQFLLSTKPYSYGIADKESQSRTVDGENVTTDEVGNVAKRLD